MGLFLDVFCNVELFCRSWIFLALAYGMYGITRHTRKLISRAGIRVQCNVVGFFVGPNIILLVVTIFSILWL